MGLGSLSSYYRPMPDGRFRISGAALHLLERDQPDRVLVTSVGGRYHKILMLDKPLRVGEESGESGRLEFILYRIRVRETPGWPPVMPPSPARPGFLTIAECRLKAVRFKAGTAKGQEGIEYEIEHRGTLYTAWQVGCPPALLKCVHVTVAQEGTLGQRLGDVQEMRVVCTN